MRFKDRVRTTEISPEFIQHATDYADDDVEAAIDDIVLRLERTYNCVAEYEKSDARFESYRIRVIPTREADPDEVARGMQSISHWLGTASGGNEDE